MPSNGNNYSPFSLLCVIGGFGVSVLTQSLPMAMSLTGNVCMPLPYEASSLSLAS